VVAVEVMWWWYVWRESLARATFDTWTINQWKGLDAM
jgi:hypothetical protein